MKKGQIAEGRIDHVVFPNKGIAITEEGDKVVVKNTIPGQKVSFLVNKVRKGKAEGRLLEILEKSPLEEEPSCPHFGECGGSCVILKHGNFRYRNNSVFLEYLCYLGKGHIALDKFMLLYAFYFRLIVEISVFIL